MESVTYRDTPTCSADVHGGRATPVHDAAGNMTAVPQPDTPTSSYTLTWDAWNRLVKVADGTTTIAEYAWDGSNRRIVKKIYAAGVLDETRHIYLSRSNQVLEERVDTSTSADRQFTWGTRYIDDLVLRTRDTDANGTLDESLYALQDANWNAAALVSSTGTVVERFRYTPYGRSTVLDANFAADADGISDYDWEYRFTSREYDSETALHYFRARFCHDGMGRFVGRDPLEFVDGGNLFAGYFVPNKVDPLGTTCLTDRLKCEKACLDWPIGFGECAASCKRTYGRCMSDQRLEQQLISCCERARTADDKPCREDCENYSTSCEDEAADVIGALSEARQTIWDLGGPSIFSFNGPNCEDTQRIPEGPLQDATSGCGTIGWRSTGKNYKPFGYDIWWPFGDHNWLELTCGDEVFTIDFWKGGDVDYRRPGKDAYGVCSNY